MPNLYNLRVLAPNHFAMAKFNSDFNVEAVYELVVKGSGYTCNCPAGQRTVKLKPCKHQRMMPFMLGAVNTNRFYDPDTGNWAAPLAGMDAVIDNEPPVVETGNPIAAAATNHLLEDMIPQPPVETPHPVQAQAAEAAHSQPPRPTGAPIVTRRI